MINISEDTKSIQDSVTVIKSKANSVFDETMKLEEIRENPEVLQQVIDAKIALNEMLSNINMGALMLPQLINPVAIALENSKNGKDKT